MSNDEAPKKVDLPANDRRSISSKTSKANSIMVILTDIDSDFVNEYRRRVTSGNSENVICVSGSQKLDDDLLALMLMKSDKTLSSINDD